MLGASGNGLGINRVAKFLSEANRGSRTEV